MLILDLKTYREKIMGCWTGKNIGGVLGAPFECLRQMNQIDFYTQDLSMGPPPNDDLDLQIVWLSAVERYQRQVNASILGEYWLSYIIPNWVEYGMGKANLRAGLIPPLSGVVDNTYKDSNGCFIRSEIWACLAPGHPEIAVRYAYEDAIVDHEGEGVFGEIFFSAIESSAFVESDNMTLINIGLSYIPKECAVSIAVRKAIECYENNIEFFEARKIIHNTAPGTFGIQGIKLKDIKKEENEGMSLGTPGFDAPENVAFVIAAWLYGKGDFEKSIILANSLGEDTDCTCATLGAILGIIIGAGKIPERWTKPLDDKITTLCINKTSKGIWVPETVTQLANRIIRTVPGFLGQDLCDVLAEDGMKIICNETKECYCVTEDEYMYRMNSHCKDGEISIKELVNQGAYRVNYTFPAFRVAIDYKDSIYFNKMEDRIIGVKVYNAFYLNEQQWVKIQAYYPRGVDAINSDTVELPLNNLSGTYAETTFQFHTVEFHDSRLEIVISVSLVGRHSSGLIKVILFQKN